MIRLIALDIDSTLLMPDRSLPEEPFGRIFSATEKGAQIAIASGRSFRSAARFAGLFGDDSLVICYNGAVIKTVSGRTLYEDAVCVEMMRKVISYAYDNGLYIQFYRDDDIVVDNAGPGSYLDPDRQFTDVREEGDLRRAELKPAPKLLIFADPSEIERHKDILNEMYGDTLSFFCSDKSLLEVVNRGTEKGKALAACAELLGISQSEVMAAGDNENDLPMIRWAGTGVAVANAVDTLKEAADYVSPYECTYGVADAVSRFVR